jgi:hypothetical protein
VVLVLFPQHAITSIFKTYCKRTVSPGGGVSEEVVTASEEEEEDEDEDEATSFLTSVFANREVLSWVRIRVCSVEAVSDHNWPKTRGGGNYLYV